MARALLPALLILTGLSPAMPPAVAAQTAACAIPAAVDPGDVAAAVPEVTPTPVVIVPVRRGVATPEAEPAPEATPVATPDPLALLATELTDVTRALAACLSAGEAELVATLATERYLGQLYGGNLPLPRSDYLALAAELDPVPTEIRAVDNVQRDGDERATAEVTSVVGRQLLRSRWSFVPAPESDRAEGESRWRIDHEEALPLEPPADVAEIGVTIDEYSYALSDTSVDGPNVVLSGRNGGQIDHEILVLQFADGVTTDDLLRGTGPGLPAGVTYVGQATVPVADRVDLVLVDLEPGTYTIVCLFLTPEGIPHLALGMEASFTVER